MKMVEKNERICDDTDKKERVNNMHIKEFMFRKQLSQSKMASLLGISNSSFSKILTGNQNFSKELALMVEELSDGLVSRDECLFPEKYPDFRIF